MNEPLKVAQMSLGKVSKEMLERYWNRPILGIEKRNTRPSTGREQPYNVAREAGTRHSILRFHHSALRWRAWPQWRNVFCICNLPKLTMTNPSGILVKRMRGPRYPLLPRCSGCKSVRVEMSSAIKSSVPSVPHSARFFTPIVMGTFSREKSLQDWKLASSMNQNITFHEVSIRNVPYLGRVKIGDSQLFAHERFSILSQL